jgi:transposase
MRKIRDVLRLTHALGMSRRLVGEATGIGKTAVGEYVRRAAVAGLSWPIPDGIDDAELERRLFPPTDASSSAVRPEPDWSHIHAELKQRGVTLALLWQEYRAEHAQGYVYSWFCERYSTWRKCISPTMRQIHVAGEKLFVDWAGDTIPVFDAATGEEHRAHIFVAALGASNYTYAEARWTETLPDWIGAHVNALAAIGGVPKALVPDNLKAGITKPSRYEPGINRTYEDLADHYGCVVLPTRVMKPRDKTIASYCTSFWGWDDSGVVGVATAMAFDDHDSRRYLPQSTVEAVGVVLLDEPLAAPLMDGGSCDGEPCRDLTCGEHATAAQALMSACQLIGGADEGDLFGVEEQSLRAAPSVAIEDVSDLTVAVLIEHSIDGGDEFGFELADLGDGQRPLEHQRARSAAR